VHRERLSLRHGVAVDGDAQLVVARRPGCGFSTLKVVARSLSARSLLALREDCAVGPIQSADSFRPWCAPMLSTEA
jgi:hypothetical protein